MCLNHKKGNQAQKKVLRQRKEPIAQSLGWVSPKSQEEHQFVQNVQIKVLIRRNYTL